MLETLMVAEQSDPAVVAVARSAADEIDLLVGVAEDVRYQAWPQHADDTYGLLAVHERMLSIPTDPTATLVSRQAAVKAAIQGRKSGSTANWVARMNTAMRGQQWTWERNTPGAGQITIRVPWAADSFSAAQVQALARRITPAHIEIVMAYSQGFIVGVSRVGEDAI